MGRLLETIVRWLFPAPWYTDEMHAENERVLREAYAPPRYVTPTELARETGLNRSDVVRAAARHGIPIFQGRIERESFLMALLSRPQDAGDANVVLREMTFEGEGSTH